MGLPAFTKVLEVDGYSLMVFGIRKKSKRKFEGNFKAVILFASPSVNWRVVMPLKIQYF